MVVMGVWRFGGGGGEVSFGCCAVGSGRGWLEG